MSSHVYAVCVRRRSVKEHAFLEVYLTFAHGALTLPSTLPSRFKERIERSMPIDAFMHGYEIRSSAPKDATCRTLENVMSDGMWVVESDWLGKGGVPEEGVPFLPTVFGVPVNVPHGTWWSTLQLAFGVRPANAPIVVYHGTGKEHVSSILAQGLRPTFGMMGDAVYFGSFWKAYRFATLTQDYKDRDGAIFRCLAFWKHMHLQSFQTTRRCGCTKCGDTETLSDHTQRWAKRADAVLLTPCKIGDKWVVRNEEYAARTADGVHLDTLAFVKRAAPGSTYEPWNRTVKLQ